MKLSKPQGSSRQKQVIYKVFPTLQVSRETFVGGRCVNRKHAGKYVYFESFNSFIYVNHEPVNTYSGSIMETPYIHANRGHTPVARPLPTKCTEHYTRDLLLQLMRKLSQPSLRG